MSLFVLGWCAGEWFFRGLAGRLDQFLRPAGAERTPTALFEFFVWTAELVAMARRVAVCLRGTAGLAMERHVRGVLSRTLRRLLDSPARTWRRG